MTPTQKAEQEALLEQLAELEHEQWAKWARHLLYHADGEPNLSERRRKRWGELLSLRYDELTEEWKEYDREWARKVLEIVSPLILKARADAIEEAAKMCDFERREYEKSSKEFDRMGKIEQGTREAICAVTAQYLAEGIRSLSPAPAEGGSDG